MSLFSEESMTRVFHFDLAYTKGWSGGDNCTFETLRHFAKNPVLNIHVTTENCRAIYEKKGLCESEHLQFLTVPDHCKNPTGISLFIAFFKRIRAANRLLKNIEWRDDDVVILHNEFFVNTIPARIPTARNPRCHMFYWIHMISPDLFKGFEGQFTGSLHLPAPAFIHYWLSQRLCAKLMIPTGKIISHNPYYAELLPRLFPKCDFELVYPYSGVDPQFRQETPSDNFEFDCIWLGRFHPQKGLFDLIDIVAQMREHKPDVLVAVIGGGDAAIEKTVREMIQQRGLEKNITLLGPLFDTDKYSALRKAKIYLMTSHFEGYCNVMVEALTQGLPVVAYDAPFHGVFQEGVLKVPMQDTSEFSHQALPLLSDEPRRSTLAQAAFDAGNKHTWEYVAEKTYRMIFPKTDG